MGSEKIQMTVPLLSSRHQPQKQNNRTYDTSTQVVERNQAEHNQAERNYYADMILNVFRGSGFVPVIYLEVIPLLFPDSGDAVPDFSNFSVKHYLQEQTRKDLLSQSSAEDSSLSIKIEWSRKFDKHKQETSSAQQGGGAPSTCSAGNDNGLALGFLRRRQEERRACVVDASIDVPTEIPLDSIPVFFLPSNDPMVLEPLPCAMKCCAPQYFTSSTQAMITSAALVRILPPQKAIFVSETCVSLNPPSPTVPSSCLATTSFLHQQLSGESADNFLPRKLEEEILCNHNPDTIQALFLRMSKQCEHRAQIGTTNDAFLIRKRAKSRSRKLQEDVQARLRAPEAPQETLASVGSETIKSTGRSMVWEPSLLVHSPNHADGKTMLIQALAKKIGCSRIHLIRPGPLLAKYGVHADAGLESLIHGILMSAAVQPESAPVCIILDNLDAMMPPQLSGRSGVGDASIPVFNAIASYLKNITVSLLRSSEFPFPVKNNMYNLGGSGGRILTVRFCLVGIVTCPDDGWRSFQRGSDSSLIAGGRSTIFDAMAAGRYRLPSLTAQTRLAAFLTAFERLGVVLDDGAQKQLFILAASAAWAKGSSFHRVANALVPKLKSDERGSRKITCEELETAFAVARSNSSSFAHVTFQSSDDSRETSGEGGTFASVGGNMKAKESLEDALALDPEKRRILAHFNLSPPTGILLYGPPGCGKTLLAKAVARLLRAPPGDADSSLPVGGTFISLGSSDLVRAEIGTSEKMLVSAFDFAEKHAPSVIFLDEFQALFTERSRGGSGKLASTLLQCMDDTRRWKDIESPTTIREELDEVGSVTLGVRLVVLGATNTPWMVDSAFLRPGRFDRVVHVALPTLRERESILKVHTSRMKIQHSDTLHTLCRSLADRTQGFSGADLAALCRAAAIRALSSRGEDCWMEERHFMNALDADVRASSDDGLVTRLLTWKP